VKRTSVDHQLRPSHVSQRAKSESPPSALSTVVTTTSVATAVVHRTATAPAFSNDVPSSTATGNPTAAPWTTPATTQPVTGGGRDVSLMSTLLRALRSYSTTPTTNCQTGCHGSPVMVLKDLIDAHFSDAAAATASSHASPVMNAANVTSRVCIQSVHSACSASSSAGLRWVLLMLQHQAHSQNRPI